MYYNVKNFDLFHFNRPNHQFKMKKKTTTTRQIFEIN